jgi:hypothetical protein
MGRRWTIELSEPQLRLLANAVEDWHRFLAGQTEMSHACAVLDNGIELSQRLAALQPMVTPKLGRGASYGWDGGDCPNAHQRKAIAMSYCLYREIAHQLTLAGGRQSWSVYQSPTLTCEEGGELPIVKLK